MNDTDDKDALRQKLEQDVQTFVKNEMPGNYSSMSEDFYAEIVDNVMDCSNYKNGKYDEADIRAGYERKKLRQELENDVQTFVAGIFLEYHSYFPESFFQGIVDDVVLCSNFENGSYNDADIRMGFEREVASRYGIEI